MSTPRLLVGKVAAITGGLTGIGRVNLILFSPAVSLKEGKDEELTGFF
jgi:hypothetical protein